MPNRALPGPVPVDFGGALLAPPKGRQRLDSDVSYRLPGVSVRHGRMAVRCLLLGASRSRRRVALDVRGSFLTSSLLRVETSPVYL